MRLLVFFLSISNETKYIILVKGLIITQIEL